MATVSGLNTFTAGTPAKASEVNTNFNVIKTFVEGLSTAANIDGGAITNSKLGPSAVTSDKISNNTIVYDDLAVALQNLLVPVGTIAATARSTAPAGWLMCDGASTASYPVLASYVGATTPNLRGKFPLGKSGSGVGSTLLGSGGSEVIAEGNLPAHTHAIDHDHPAKTSGDASNGHTHAQLTGLIEYVYSGGPTAIAVVTTPLGGANGLDPTYSTGGNSTPHDHTTNLDAFSGTSGGGTGGGTGYWQPFVAVNYIIKHD